MKVETMTQIRHMRLDVKGALRNWGKRQLKSFASAFTVDGRQCRTADEARDALLQCLSEGKLFLPMGECDGFDFKTGCPGHRKEPSL